MIVIVFGLFEIVNTLHLISFKHSLALILTLIRYYIMLNKQKQIENFILNTYPLKPNNNHFSPEDISGLQYSKLPMSVVDWNLKMDINV